MYTLFYSLSNAKIKEVTAKIQVESYIAMLQYVEDIYNLGNLKIPRYFKLRYSKVI